MLHISLAKKTSHLIAYLSSFIVSLPFITIRPIRGATILLACTDDYAQSMQYIQLIFAHDSILQKERQPMKLTGLQNTTYQATGTPIGSGGEGDIYRVSGAPGDSGKVAKIYKSEAISRELEDKLKLMVKKPPNASVLSQVAWPLDVVYENGKFCGFIMQELSINAELGDIYKYPATLPLPEFAS